LNRKSDECDKKARTIGELKETVGYSVDFVAKCESAIKVLRQNNAVLLREVKSLKSREAKLLEGVRDFKLAYLQQKEIQYGVDLSNVRDKVIESVSVQDAEKAIKTGVSRSVVQEKRTRPILNKALLENVSEETIENEPVSETESIVSLTVKQMITGGTN
jgi:hypothetical protein